MSRYLTFFSRSLAVVSILVAACSSSGGGGGSSGTITGGDAGEGDGSTNPADGGGDGASDYDGGPKNYATIPSPPETVYTCAQEVHVATTGNDGTGDGSSGNPYKTIAFGLSKATAAGTCVQVHQGTYAEAATLSFPNAGGSSSPIVLRSADGKGKAVIDATAIGASGVVILIDKDHLIVDGFEVKNASTTAGGIHVVRFDGGNANGCAGSVLRNSKLTGGNNVVKVFQKTQGVLVEYNEISGTTGGTPLSLTGASGGVFRGNSFHDLDSGDNGTIQLAGGSNTVLFEKNLFQDVTSLGGSLALGDNCGATCDNDPDHYAAVNVIARNNVFVRTVHAFDVLGCKDCKILANTVIDSGLNFGTVFKVGSATTNGVSKPSVNVTILDNLVTSPYSLMGYIMSLDPASATGLNMDYNLYWNGPKGVSFGQSHPQTADTNSKQGDPLFSGATDLRPGPGSPAIGLGTNLKADVPDDFLNAARPASGNFDVGAFQH